jgi:hypothetical protein
MIQKRHYKGNQNYENQILLGRAPRKRGLEGKSGLVIAFDHQMRSFQNHALRPNDRATGAIDRKEQHDESSA